MQRTITLPDLYARKPQTPGVWLLQDSQSRCKRWQKSNLYSLFQTYLVLNVVILEVDLYTVHAAILWAKPMCRMLPADSHGTSGIPLARFTQGSLRIFFFAKFTVWTFSWPHTKYTCHVLQPSIKTHVQWGEGDKPPLAAAFLQVQQRIEHCVIQHARSWSAIGGQPGDPYIV